MDKMTVNKFKLFLVKKGMNAYRFARVCGVSSGTLYRVLQGINPSRRIAVKICKYSGAGLNLKDFGYDE